MKPAPQYEFTEKQHDAVRRSRRLEYVTLAYLGSLIPIMYVVLGSSQAMKTAWVEDCLSLIPPLCFLIGTHICWKKPNKHFPYGYHRVISILFLCAALALLGMGTFLIIDASMKLVTQDYATIGMKELLGVDVWLGWWMILVLFWGTFPPLFLGRAKLKYAQTLNDKILITDGKMNKADWKTGVAAMAGVVGIGMGWWWADPVAAGFIAFDILHDGWSQTKDAVTGLVNRAPTSLENEYLNLPDKVNEALLTLPWVGRAQNRLYEHGHLIFGEGFVSLKQNEQISPHQIQKAIQKIQGLDWRLQNFTLTVLPEEEEHQQ